MMGGRTFEKKIGVGGNSETTKTVTSEKKIAVVEFTPHAAGKHQLVTHDMVKEHTLQELQKDPRHGRDLAQCLRKGVNTGMPTLTPIGAIEEKGTQTDEEQKMKQDGHDVEWQMERKEFSMRKNVCVWELMPGHRHLNQSEQ